MTPPSPTSDPRACLASTNWAIPKLLGLDLKAMLREQAALGHVVRRRTLNERSADSQPHLPRPPRSRSTKMVERQASDIESATS
jgi:hypothetical protein